MRKLTVFSVFIALFVVQPSFADNIRDACYATSKCGAKANIKALTTGAGIGAGAVMGFSSPIPGGLVMGGLGGYLAGDKLGGYMAEAYSANEYIYFKDGTCLECDNHQIGENFECPNGTIISNGGTVLKCQVQTFGDRWRDHTLYPCPASPIQNKAATGTIAEIEANISKTVATGVQVFSGDACLMIKCGNGGVYNGKDTCVAGSKSDDALTNEQKCKAAEATGAVWDSSDRTCQCKKDGKKDTTKRWDPARNTCVAVSKSDDSKKKQDDKTPPVNPPAKDEATGICTCDPDTLEILARIQAKYDMISRANPADSAARDIVALAKKVIAGCADKGCEQIVDIARLNTMVEMYEKGMADKEAADANALILQRTSQYTISIRSNFAKIEEMQSGFETSKWKNEDGKFNTARLVSDSIAGVVLGTASGLITSHVVKKNQLKKGFEDLNCSIGGQVVAGWADEFIVGVN